MVFLHFESSAVSHVEKKKKTKKVLKAQHEAMALPTWCVALTNHTINTSRELVFLSSQSPALEQSISQGPFKAEHFFPAKALFLSTGHKMYNYTVF